MKKKKAGRKPAKPLVHRVHSYYLPRHKLRAKLRAVVGELNGLRKHHAETECKVERQAARIVALQAEISELRSKLSALQAPAKPASEIAVSKPNELQTGGTL